MRYPSSFTTTTTTTTAAAATTTTTTTTTTATTTTTPPRDPAQPTYDQRQQSWTDFRIEGPVDIMFLNAHFSLMGFLSLFPMSMCCCDLR